MRGNDVRMNKSGILVNHSRETGSSTTTRASPGHRHRGLGPVVQRRHRAQHLGPQRRLGHRRRRRGGRGHGLDHRAQQDEQQQGLRHLRAQGQPRDQGQRGERQRHLGHLGQRGQQRPRQHRLGRQHRPGQPRPAGPDHAQAAAVLQRPLRRHLRAVRPDRAEHADRRRRRRTGRRRRGALPLRRHRQREQRLVPVPDRQRLGRGLGRVREPVHGDPRSPARTRSRCARSTRPSNPDPTPATHTWTIAPRPHGVPPITTILSGPTTRRSAPMRRSSSPPTRAARRSSARWTARRSRCMWTTPYNFLLARGSVTTRWSASGCTSSRCAPSTGTRRRAWTQSGVHIGSEAVWSWKVEPPPVAGRGGLRRDHRREHQAHQGPDRLRGQRHRDRRAAGSRSTSTGTSSTASGWTRDPEPGLRRRHGDERPDHRVRLRRPARRRHRSQRRHGHPGRAQPGGRDRARGRRPASPDGNAYGNSIRGNTLTGNKHGIAVYSGTRNAVIRDNAIGANIGDGIRLEHARGNRIEHNEVTGSGGAAPHPPGRPRERHRRQQPRGQHASA